MSEIDMVEISTERLILKRLSAKLHAKEVNEVVLDSFDTLQPWLPWAKTPPTLKETAKGLERVSCEPHFCFRIYLKETMKLIGACGILLEDVVSMKTYEIGYWLHKTYTGKGYMQEAIMNLITFAVEKLGCQRFHICCNEENTQSHKVAQKCGFKLINKSKMTIESRPDWGEFLNYTFERLV